MYKSDIRILIENDLRSGNVLAAKHRLSAINTAKVERSERLALATCCRRAGMTHLGLTLLNRIVYPPASRVTTKPATDNELAEYGVLLHRAGLQWEAEQILTKIDTQKAPEALLYQAFLKFNNWDHEGAVPLLRRYVTAISDPYAQLIGRVNLAAALVWSEQWDEALEICNSNIAQAQTGNYLRLFGNSLELRAQIFIYRRDFDRARADLDLLQPLLKANDTHDLLFFKKFDAILRGFKSRTTEPILEARDWAMSNNLGEAARDLDRYSLYLEFNQERFNQLLFGTPSRHFREVLCRQLRRQANGRHWMRGDGHGVVIDLETGKVTGHEIKEELDQGGRTHALMVAFAKDLYRPQTIGSLFSSLYPDEIFNPKSSPTRVHQRLRVLRGFLRDNKLDVRIVENEGLYSLICGPNVSLKLCYDYGTPDRNQALLRHLSAVVPLESAFTAKDARERLGMSRSSFQRFVTWGAERGAIARLGDFNNVRYILKRAA